MTSNMAQRKLEKRNIRNIQRSKGSYYVTLPIELMRKSRWQERQKAVAKQRGGGLNILDWKKGGRFREETEHPDDDKNC